MSLGVVVFPNYAAKLCGSDVMLEPSHPLLLDDLTKQFPCVTVAAMVHCGTIDGIYRTLTNRAVDFVALGAVDSSDQSWRKVVHYLKALPSIIRAVAKSEFCYVFTPGNVGLLVAIACILRRRRFALYLRGDWKKVTPRAMHLLWKKAYRRAEFVLYTGMELPGAIMRLNPNVERVVPMSPILAMTVLSRAVQPARFEDRVLFVGQIIREKGIYEIVEALALLNDVYARAVTLTFIGAGNALSDLKRRIAEGGLTKQVQFLGAIEDPATLAQQYRTHSVFCLPSYHEGFPRVLYEAMYFELPIITSRVGQIETLLRDQLNALLIESGDARALAESLAQLLGDAHMRKRIGRAGRATVEPMLRSWQSESHGRQVARRLSGLTRDLSRTGS